MHGRKTKNSLVGVCITRRNIGSPHPSPKWHACSANAAPALLLPPSRYDTNELSLS